MGLIFRYLAKETYITMFAVTGILIMIFMSHQFVHYLGDAAGGRLTSRAVLQMMCIQVPLLAGFIAPLGLFLGILLTYGRLYLDNEMIILAASGISQKQILSMSCVFAALVTLLVAMLMLYVEPKMAQYRDQIIASALAASPIERVSPGRFQTVGNWVLYTENITRDRQKMANIFAAKIPTQKATKNGAAIDVVTAKHAFQKISAGETFLVLANGYRYTGSPGHGNYQIIRFGEYGVRIPHTVPKLGRPEEAFPTGKLWQKSKTDKNAAAELHWRLAMPISAFILALFAVPLSEVKARQGKFRRLLPAMVIYIIYLDLLFLGRAWIESGRIPPALGLWWIHGIMLLLAGIVLYYSKVIPSSPLPLRERVKKIMPSPPWGRGLG